MRRATTGDRRPYRPWTSRAALSRWLSYRHDSFFRAAFPMRAITAPRRYHKRFESVADRTRSSGTLCQPRSARTAVSGAQFTVRQSGTSQGAFQASCRYPCGMDEGHVALPSFSAHALATSELAVLLPGIVAQPPFSINEL